MAKKEGPKKSDVIREAISKGITETSEIIEFGKKAGIELSNNLVYQVREKAQGGSPKKKAAGRPAKAAANTTDAAGLVKAVEALVASYGEDKIKKAVEFVTSLQ